MPACAGWPRCCPPASPRTILADRGFADTKLFDFLSELGFDYVIRLKGNTRVGAADGTVRPAQDWVGQGGRARKLRDATVTEAHCPVGAAVCVHAKGMKEPWCLVTGNRAATAPQIIKLYSKRWTVEPSLGSKLTAAGPCSYPAPRRSGWGTARQDRRRDCRGGGGERGDHRAGSPALCRRGAGGGFEPSSAVPALSAQMDGEAEARLIALACSPPPEGRARWTLRVLAEHMVVLGHVEAVSHETVRTTLKETNSNHI